MNQYTTRLWAVILIVSLLLPLAACGKDTTATTMHLKRTEGTVTVSDDAGKDVPLLEDMGLYSGYGVDTLSESYAWINLDDVKLTKMDQESEIAIQKEGKALDIEIISGSLFFNVTQPLEEDETLNIRTSTMLMGIRGTCGWMEDRDGVSQVYVLEGTVECSAGGQTVQVNAGEMAELAADGKLVVQSFTVQNILTFVMDDLIQDSDLCSDIYEASGLDVLGSADGEDSGGDIGGYGTVIPWSEAGLEDHVMDWKDENLEAAMREITGIYDRDIMLSDVWELTELELSDRQISVIDALSDLINLTKLSLKSNQISDISALSGLTNLITLKLGGNQISDISMLSGLTNLTELDLDNNQISDISTLSGLTNLSTLRLSFNQISDIGVLSGLTNLSMLLLGGNQISDISALSGLINLIILDLQSIQINDISMLSSLTNLVSLGLSSNQISDISVLSGLTNLTTLFLYDNQISDISALSSLTNLTRLYLENNQISDISALSGLTNLTELDLTGNPIEDYSSVEFIEQNGGILEK